MDSIIETFHIDWKIIIAQGVNFGIVFLVLYVFALKPLNKLMNERSEKIGKGLDDAISNAKLLEETNKQYDEMLAKAKLEATNIFNQGKKENEANKTQMLEDAKSEAASIVEKGRNALLSEKIKMIEEAKNEVAKLGLLISEKIMTEKNK